MPILWIPYTIALRTLSATCALMLAMAITCTAPAIAQSLEQAAAESDQSDADAMTAEAKTLRQEQYEIGASLLEEHPTEFDAWRIMGYVHSTQGNQDEMAACWRKCRELQPLRPVVYYQLGRYEFQIENYEEAIASWRRALEIDATYPEIHRRIGDALLKLGRAGEARSELQLAVSADPEDDSAQLLLAEAQYELQDFTAAKQDYAKAAQMQPMDPRAVYGLMKSSSRLGETELVQQYAERFQELQAAMAEADQKIRREFDDLKQMRENLANTCLDAGRFYLTEEQSSQAEQLLLRSIELRPGDANCHDLLAGLYLQRNDAPRALEQLVAIARLQPGNAPVRQKLGFLLARLGHLEQAEQAFESSLKVDQNDAASNRALAKFLLNTGRGAQRAHQLASKAVELDPSAESFFVLGWSHAVTGNRAEAVKALDVALQLSPSNPTYQQLREALNPPQ